MQNTWVYDLMCLFIAERFLNNACELTGRGLLYS